MDRTITLTTTHVELMALYERGGTINPFKSPLTRQYRRVFLSIMGVVLLLAVGAVLRPDMAWFGIMALITTLGAVALMAYVIGQVLTYRWRISRWAKNVESQGAATLHMRENGMTLLYGGVEYISPWSALKNVAIHEDHIVVQGPFSHVLPKSSMKPQEFEDLCSILRTKVLDGTTTQESGPLVE